MVQHCEIIWIWEFSLARENFFWWTIIVFLQVLNSIAKGIENTSKVLQPIR